MGEVMRRFVEDSSISEKMLIGIIQVGKTTGILFLLWWILSSFCFEEFAISTYWNLSDNFLSATWKAIWPLLVYAVLTIQTYWLESEPGQSGYSSTSLGTKFMISLTAGVFEELQHRGVYIFFGLIIIYILDMFFDLVIAAVFLIFFIAFLAWAFSEIRSKGKAFILSAIVFAIFLAVWLGIRSLTHGNPVSMINSWIFGIYQWLIAHTTIMCIVFATLMFVFKIIQGASQDKYLSVVGLIFATVYSVIIFTVWVSYSLPLSIMAIDNLPFVQEGVNYSSWLLYVGAILWSNTKFREGHQYQGPAGMLNSYIFGFYMFYVAFTFGLMYAIIAHFLYDLVLFIIVHAIDRLRGV